MTEQNRVPIKMVEGVQIYCLADGKFTAQCGKPLYGGQAPWVTLASLRDLEKRIMATLLYTRAFEFNIQHVPNAIEEHEIVGIEAGRLLEKNRNLLQTYRLVYHWDDEAVAEIRDMADRRAAANAAFEQEEDALRARLKRVTVDSLQEVRADQ